MDEVTKIQQHIQTLSEELKNPNNQNDSKKIQELEGYKKQLAKMTKKQITMRKDSKIIIKDEVTKADIAATISKWTGVPLNSLMQEEKEKLINLEKILSKSLIGQDNAISAIAKALRRARTGLKDPNRPIGSFMFLGPTGVGKTELAKILAEVMFGDKNAMIRIDMTEYMERHSADGLI